MKKRNLRKFLFGGLLAVMMFTGIGCVVAERPYYYGTYRRYDYERPYYPYRYYSYRYDPYYPYRYYRYGDRYGWHRDNNRWDRD